MTIGHPAPVVRVRALYPATAPASEDVPGEDNDDGTDDREQPRLKAGEAVVADLDQETAEPAMEEGVGAAQNEASDSAAALLLRGH